MNRRVVLLFRLFAILLTVISAAAGSAAVTTGHSMCASGFVSSIYTIDHAHGVISGILAGTTPEKLKSGFTNAPENIALYDRNGVSINGSLITTGMSMQLIADSNASETLQIAVKGDASGDGQISITDYTLARLDILGLKSLSSVYKVASDVSGDGQISISDYTLMRLHILGLKQMSTDVLPLTGCLIGLDPGHQAVGNYDLEPIAPGSSKKKAKVSSGTQGRFTRVAEYIVNLQVALKLRNKLEALGATVIMTRDTHDVDISNSERACMMNDAVVDCWLRIHEMAATIRR